jgi:hypothetical protein
MGMFIPGIFCGEACGLGEADGIGMLCMCGVGEVVGEALDMPGMVFSIAGVGDGEAFGAGVGAGIPCLCCARKKDAHSKMRVRTLQQRRRLTMFDSNLGESMYL